MILVRISGIREGQATVIEKWHNVLMQVERAEKEDENLMVDEVEEKEKDESG